MLCLLTAHLLYAIKNKLHIAPIVIELQKSSAVEC